MRKFENLAKFQKLGEKNNLAKLNKSSACDLWYKFENEIEPKIPKSQNPNSKKRKSIGILSTNYEVVVITQIETE